MYVEFHELYPLQLLLLTLTFKISGFNVKCKFAFSFIAGIPYFSWSKRARSIATPVIFIDLQYFFFREKMEEIWLSPMTKAPTPTEKATWQHQKRHQNFDYTTIADRLRAVSWSNNSHPTGVVKPVYERSTFPLTAK